MRKQLVLLAFYMMISVVSFAQYPKGYFRNPLDIPISLVTNFGELRTDHFHMGLDIRTQQRENLPVYASAEGYISRVEIEEGGYGNCLYVTHPNGFTTIYAHLNDFFPELHQYVKNIQYKEEKWEQSIELTADQFPVTKGSFIAYSGNTGASQGPHLHFEIMETSSGKRINPLLFDFEVEDDRKPFINRFFVYDRNYSTYAVKPKEIWLKKTDSIYTTKDSLVEIPSNKISFGFFGEDIGNTSSFRYGIYEAELFIDSIKKFSYRLDGFDYKQSRYMNACIDYKTKYERGNYIKHLSILPGNNLTIFDRSVGDGIIHLTDTIPHLVTFKTRDEFGNESVLEFKYVWKPGAYEPLFFTQQTIPFKPNQSNNYESENFNISLDDNALYDTVSFFYAERENTNKVIHQVHYGYVPLQESYIAVAKEQFPNPRKVLMQLTNNRYRQVHKPAYKGNGIYESSFNQFGTLNLLQDEIPPVIATSGWRKDKLFVQEGAIRIKVTDNITGIRNFRGELDGKWIMFQKRGSIFTHHFDKNSSLEKHELKIIAEDAVGNQTIRTYSFELREKLPVVKKKKKATKRKKNGNTSKRRR